ncbi:MAG: protein kinase, partial [Betaproteobacteria bacterium]
METVTEYVRICPTCRVENAPEVMRCACGAILAGIDVVRKDSSPIAEPSTTAAGAALSSGESLVCQYSDCGQASPPGSTICAYCNRALDGPAQNLAPKSLLNLPAILAARFRLVRSLPAKGSEAELLIVEPNAGGPEQIAKIYRQGIAPRADVQARIAQIDPRRRVQILESGFADGHAYELMEYCVHGSLRDRMQCGPLAGAELHSMIQQLAAAIASVHAAGLVHRDLKPENVLVRSLDPLELVLTDFSIASVLEGTQRFTGVARTLPYAAPESLSGVIDGKSDYWALGMIVLEAVSGTHPFAGLSEAVILHQLTTRNVDVTAVVDRNVRKLLRGLLLREPQTRWGESALARWLAGDPTLPEPFELGPAAGFSEPYRLGEVVCTTPEQLAVALATHWREGIADLGNSQLVQWFRGVQKDHNVVRLLIELRHERQLHVDVQLLKLILYLAPGIPPVWRGESIALPAILAHASQALEGDVEASHWLHALYQHRVLE